MPGVADVCVAAAGLCCGASGVPGIHSAGVLVMETALTLPGRGFVGVRLGGTADDVSAVTVGVAVLAAATHCGAGALGGLFFL